MTRRGHAKGWIALLAMALPSGACLVTSAAEFQDPERTAPVLLSETGLPDLREILVVDAQTPKVTFSAQVRSEEDLGEPIRVRLLTDYGIDFEGNPYRAAISGASVPPATSAGEARLASVDWFPSSFPGCHTVTLVVSHAFRDVPFGCPEDPADASSLTWFVFVCEEGGPCPPPVDDPRLDCPKPVTSCPDPASGETSTTGP